MNWQVFGYQLRGPRLVCVQPNETFFLNKYGILLLLFFMRHTFNGKSSSYELLMQRTIPPFVMYQQKTVQK